MRYKENKIALLILLVCCCQAIVAQNISVSSFKLLDNDLTANTTGTMERDQNGEVAALIKVITTEQGFVFDGGMVGVVKTLQRVGEVWVYVPHGIKRIKIQHQQLGTLSEYYFPVPIDKAKTYELVLTTGKVETVVTHAINKQFVIFNVKPVNAIVELDDEVLTVDDEGYAEKGLPFGTYNYRVSCTNYHTEAGQVVVNSSGKAEVDVTLRPNFGWIKFDGTSEYHGAHIYIDNERVGQLPFTSKEIKSGTHQVRVVKSMYKAYEQQVTVSDNKTTSLNVTMNPNFANITLITNAESEIWVDGKLKGKGEWTGPMEIGEYNVEVKKESHRTQSKIVHIAALSERSIQLPSPTPIYGGLEITSNPSRATVYIDDVEVGETPMVKNDVLVGTHTLQLKKDGYASFTKQINVEEGVDNVVAGVLTEDKEQTILITSSPSGAIVKIDNVYAGTTPLSKTLAQGNYLFDVSYVGYYSSKGTKTITPDTENLDFTLTKSTTSSMSTSSSYSSSSSSSSHKKSRYRRSRYRESYNEYYKDWAWYFEGNAEYSDNYEWGGGLLTGIYVIGFNMEMAYQLNSSMDIFAMRFGWGFRCGKNFLITPQFGIVGLDISGNGGYYYDDYYYGDYYYDDSSEWEPNYSIACRFQYCLNKYFALSVTPEYDITDATFYVRAGLVLNFGTSF